LELTLNKQWDLDSLYPGGKNSEKLKKQITQLNHEIPVLIEQLQSPLTPPELAQHIQDIQHIMQKAFQVDEYCICLYSDHVQDEDALKLLDQSNHLKAKVQSLKIELDGKLGELTEKEWNELLEDKTLQSIRPFLLQKKQKLNEQLPQQIEEVINTLSVNGIRGWEDHYEQLLHRLEVPVEWDEETQKLSINEAIIQSMLDTNREKRKVTAKALEEVCHQHEDQFASIFNHFAGFRLDTYQLKGFENTQKELYEDNRIQEDSLSSMLKAIEQNQELIQRFTKRKAQLMGFEQLSYYDMYAPYFTSKSKLTYETAADIVTKQFHSFSEEMGHIADRAFNEQWIDAESRKHKGFGAFCASMPLEKQSRVLLSFKGDYQDVVTLAHELGHAYHNSILQKEPTFSQDTGTSLAETASTFAENLVLDAAIQLAETDEDRLSLLEMKITNALKYLSLIPAKFDFEKQFYEKRKAEKLSANDVKNLMLETEKRWTKNQLEEYDPYNWITISHFYSSEDSFYNIPYTIGYLFSNGIYALSKTRSEGFANEYEQLLSHTGKMSLEKLGEKFLNQDLTEEDFWQKSIQPILEAIEEFEELTEKYV